MNTFPLSGNVELVGRFQTKLSSRPRPARVVHVVTSSNFFVGHKSPQSVKGWQYNVEGSRVRTKCACAAPSLTEIGPCTHQDPPTRVSAPGKIVAVGDLHGDLQKTIHSLELAGAVSRDEDGWPKWCGGDATVVQLGDIMDRGDCEIGILMLLRDLGHQARREGGNVYMINGNHESLNVCGNFRYVTRGAFYECALASGLKNDLALNWEEQLNARIELYSPGGLVAKELAKNPTVLIVNDTVFAHGGLLPIHVNYGLERINAEMAAWMRGDLTEKGKAAPPYIAMGGPNSILWNRTLAQERFPTADDKMSACSTAKKVLKKLKAQRLVVGHTPQLCGCNCECNGQVWRVDVGMSAGVMNAKPQVMIIDKDGAGDTIIDIVESVPLYDTVENNIQAASGPFESLGFTSASLSLNHSSVKLISHKLVSRLQAYK